MSMLNKTTAELTIKDSLIINGIVIAISAVSLLGLMGWAARVESREAKKNADNTAYKKK